MFGEYFNLKKIFKGTGDSQRLIRTVPFYGCRPLVRSHLRLDIANKRQHDYHGETLLVWLSALMKMSKTFTIHQTTTAPESSSTAKHTADAILRGKNRELIEIILTPTLQMLHKKKR
jgi:hypothetical protein